MSINRFLEKLKQRVSPTPVDETGMWYQDKDVVVPSNKLFKNTESFVNIKLSLNLIE